MTTISVGSFELENTVRLRGYGDKLIDKVYTKTNYMGTGYRAVNIANVGDPIVEEWSYKAHSTMQYSYNVGVDSDYNTYVPCYRYYTAVEASAKSGGTITTAGDYWSVKKASPLGVDVYETDIVIGTLYDVFVDPNDEYFFVRSSSTTKTLLRFSCETGKEVTNTYWPVGTTNVYAGTFHYGRDGFIYYCRLNGTDRELYKLNPDGSTATDWSTPYVIPQHAWGTSPNWLDVNATGYVALGCVKMGEGGPAIKVVAPDKTLSWDQTIATYNSYGVDYILIDDTGNVIADIAWGDYIYKYPSGGGTPTWTVGGPLYNPYWSAEGNQEYFYCSDSDVSASFTLWKFKSSDGSVVWYTGGQDGKSIYSFAGVAPVQVPAWEIIVTHTSNGVVRLWAHESNMGSIITSGNSVYAEALKDYRFSAKADTGYYIKEVFLDGLPIAGGSTITIPSVEYRHELHVVFEDGWVSGPFALDLRLRGNPINVQQIGSFDLEFHPSLPNLSWWVYAGHHSLPISLRGVGIYSFVQSLLTLINNERALVFLDPYVESSDLLVSASAGAQELVDHGSLQSTLQQLLNVSGFIHIEASAVPTTASTGFTPQEIFDAWMADPTVEGYILDEDMDQIGLAVIEEGGDNHILVIFAKWHPQYTRVRLDDRLSFQVGLRLPHIFGFLSQDAYATFLENSASVHLPRYAARIGSYYIPDLISFTYRLSNEKPSSLVLASVYNSEVLQELLERVDDGISIESVVFYCNTEVRNEVIQSDIGDVEYQSGAHPILTLSGSVQLRYYSAEVQLRNVFVKTVQTDGKLRLRCSQPDFYIRPGCVVYFAGGSMVVGEVVVFVSEGQRQYMELKEA